MTRFAVVGFCLASVGFAIAGEPTPAALWMIAAGIWQGVWQR